MERGLKGKGLTVFLPTVQRPSCRTDRRKMLDCLLFPAYLFFYGVSDPSIQLLVLQTPAYGYDPDELNFARPLAAQPLNYCLC